MPTEHGLKLVQLTNARDVTPRLRQELIDCWIEVTNAGGASGFPFPPVDGRKVTTATN